MKESIFLTNLRKKKRLELTDTSKEISLSYQLKSENCLKSAKILLKENLHENSISEAYYSMYNSLLSLLFLYGIKSENHTASILLLKKIFNLEDLAKIISDSKKERIEKQYYVPDKKADKSSAELMIQNAEKVTYALIALTTKTNPTTIEEIRTKFKSI